MDEYTIDLDCLTGQSAPRALTPEECDALQRLRAEAAAQEAAEAAAEAEHAEKVEKARAIVARDPDLQALLDALGVSL